MDESYFTHIPLLTAATLKTTGPVLELGAGLGSTLLLHGACAAQGRKLVTLDNDATWLGRFTNFSRSWHRLSLVEDFINLLEYKERWGLVLVDHGISEQRGTSVAALQANADMILCHDTCHFFLYGYEPLLSSFKFRWNFKPHGMRGSDPMTSVVSQTINVAELFGELGL